MTHCDRWPGCGCGTQSGPHTCEGLGVEILALDVATTTGWARGRPGDDAPRCGSIRFASKGASQNAILAACYDWFVGVSKYAPPDVLVLEDLLPFQAGLGKTNKHTGELLTGLQAVIRTVAFKRRIFKIEPVSVIDVRMHFIGGNFRREQAKGYTIQKCKSLGWLESTDENAADACALWHFFCCRFKPELAIQVSPLFNRRIAHG